MVLRRVRLLDRISEGERAMSHATARETAECIEKFGEDLKKLLKAFERDFRRFHFDDQQRANAIEHAEHLDEIADAFEALGMELSRECDQAEEDEDRRRDNPFHPRHRRLGV